MPPSCELFNVSDAASHTPESLNRFDVGRLKLLILGPFRNLYSCLLARSGPSVGRLGRLESNGPMVEAWSKLGFFFASFLTGLVILALPKRLHRLC